VLAVRLEALQTCLEKLGKRDRDLLQARYLNRSPIERIAADFAQSRRTLFRNLERVRRLLFECIDRSTLREDLA
jgi:RNA polymerase sigma-70 factor (ECF subfamily)